MQRATDEGTVCAREVDSQRKRLRMVALSSGYVGEHAHLSYATTAYGVQGAAVNSLHTMLSEVTSTASVYVGMTRGRQQNQLHVVAEDISDARARFVEVGTVVSSDASNGLDHATAQATDAVHGLANEDPVHLISDELAYLTIEVEDDEQADVLRQAEEEVARIRTEVAESLIALAETDSAYLAVAEREAATSGRLATTGRFGRRKARAREALPEWAA